MFISTGGMDIDKSKPTILLMHGSGLTHIVWSLHEQFYASHGFNVLSVDLPGHGNSDGPSIKSIEEINLIKLSLDTPSTLPPQIVLFKFFFLLAIILTL